MPSGSAPPDRGNPVLTVLERIHRLHPAIQVVLVFLMLLVLRAEILTQPPVWDTAMGLFPAAATLANNGLDLRALLELPLYLAGGPNTHSTSPVTWVTAVVLKLTGGGTPAFVALHLMHFGAIATALVVLRRFAEPVLGVGVSYLYALAVLMYPLVQVQAGYLYMEGPLLLCTALALWLWARGRHGHATVWAALAFAVREAGVIVPATLVAATILENRPVTERIRKVAMIATPAALWWGVVLRLQPLGKADSEPVVHSLVFIYYWLVRYLNRFILNVPDLTAFFIVATIAIGLTSPKLVRAFRKEPQVVAERDPEQEAHVALALSGTLILGLLGFFLLAVPVVFQHVIILPRYCLYVVPFLLLWVGHATQAMGSRFNSRISIPGVMYALLLVFFVLNRGGAFYPSDIDTEGPGNDFALTERSLAYLRLNDIQVQALDYLKTLPEETEVYYGHYEHYLLNYPTTGYSSEPLANGRSLSLEPIPNLDEEPRCMYALFNYPWLGGRKMLELFDRADAHPDYEREVAREFRDGRYVITLHRIKHATATCPA